ncbi:MAG: ABC transporter permease [Oscillospiraceae bacterium]|nr:ABC transporter permease [Oscillospiraceae bacterium]
MKNRLIAVPYLVWMAIFIVVPMAMVVFFAFTDQHTGQFTFGNMAQLGEFLPAFVDSILYAAVATLFCFLIGYPTAYYIARCRPSRQRLLMMMIILPMCMSFLLRTLAWVALLQNTGIVNSAIGLIGIGPLPLLRTPPALVLGMVYNFLPYMILPLYTVQLRIDKRVIEAAQDLGCDRKQVLRKVLLPLSMPGIAAGITMVFVPAVSTFYITQQMGPAGQMLIGDMIEDMFTTAYNPNVGAALSLVLMLMVVLCMGVMNKFSDDEEGVF